MNVGEMQRKLSRWAEQRLEDRNAGLFASRKDLRLHDLYHLLYDADWLRLAYRYVSQTSGSRTAGCDGLNLKSFNEHLEYHLRTIGEELKVQTFQPHPTRRVYIPKSNGKRRPLGIPSIRDRIVQEALRMVLEPIFEVEFYRNSFGFRPNRSTADALATIQAHGNASQKHFWVIEGDIESYFDTINHDVLMGLLRRRIRDRKLLRLVWRFLRAGVTEGRLFSDTQQGTPQGGIISPLLANVYLHELDMFLSRTTDIGKTAKFRRRLDGRANFVHIRYADDFVVMCNGTRPHAEQMRDRIRAFLADELRLKLSEEKTKVTHLDDGIRFLGYEIKRDVTGTGKKQLKFLIPREARRKLRETIKRITKYSSTGHSVRAKMLATNQHLRGWANYYRYAYCASREFSKLDQVAFWEMAHWLGKKYRLSMPQVMRRFKRQANGITTLATGDASVLRMSRIPLRRFRSRTFPNPYELPHADVIREILHSIEEIWYGEESRPGMADLHPIVLRRDRWTCRDCGRDVDSVTARVDHIRPVHRYKRPIDANTLGNLQTLCIDCHTAKTESERQMESRMR